jgi:hypothetical protein
MASENEISRGLLLILILIVAGAFVGGYVLATILNSDGIADGYTPTISMTYKKTGTGSCTFTVIGVTENDLKWEFIIPMLNPNNATIVKPTTTYVVIGDVVTISGLGGNTQYIFRMEYTFSSEAAYEIMWIQT